MFKQKDDVKLILASGSPRRKELLAGCGLNFDVVVSDVDEAVLAKETPKAMVERLALAKAMAVAAQNPGAMVLGADTTVVVDGAILGKPEDKSDAFRMLSTIQGRTHLVWGGYALVGGGLASPIVESHCTEVFMIKLIPHMIEEYIATGEPLDKAGAYAIQGVGASLIEWVKGSYTNVVGLNVPAVISSLRGAGILG